MSTTVTATDQHRPQIPTDATIADAFVRRLHSPVRIMPGAGGTRFEVNAPRGDVERAARLIAAQHRIRLEVA